MNFTELVSAVSDIVKRPDKTAQIGNAINTALARTLFKTEFTHDLVETSIPLDDTLYVQTVNLPSLVAPLTRFRKWKYVKLTGVKGFLQHIDPQNVFVPGGVQQVNCYYMIGSDLTVIAGGLSSALEVGYYQHPPVLSGANTFWLTDLCPYGIINRAAGEIFALIGDTNSAKVYLAMGEDLLTIMANDLRDQVTY